eukprot:7378017-Prymnesium_polylepis.1
MSAPRMIQSLAQALQDGEAAEEVLARLKRHYTTLGSQQTHISLVRSALMDAEHTKADYSPLRALASGEPDVASFLTKSLREQVSIQQEHRTAPAWSDAAEAALAKLELLPRAFNLSRPEQIELKRQRERSQEAKSENVVDVRGARLLEEVGGMLEAASDQASIARLVLPLLVVSGRRSVEILSDRSTFAPTANEYEA